MSIRGTDSQMYGPTGYATSSFPAGVMLNAAQWAQWQAEATAQNAAEQAPQLAAAYQSIIIPDAMPNAVIPVLSNLPTVTPFPKWSYWAVAGGAALLLFRK